MYAKLLTKDYLEYLGITNVSEDGKQIWKHGKLVNQTLSKDGYWRITLYDPAVRQKVPVDKRTATSGQITIGVHRVVYAWYKKVVPEGYVIDHKNNNKFDNNINNLQLFTPKENITKEKPSNRLIKCSLKKPLKYYEDKLDMYLYQYNLAKKQGLQELAHKLRSNISQTRGRIRYWKLYNNKGEN